MKRDSVPALAAVSIAVLAMAALAWAAWPAYFDLDAEDEVAIAATADADGNLFVLGASNEDDDLFVLKFDTAGVLQGLWLYSDALPIDFEVDEDHSLIYVLANIEEEYGIVQFDSRFSDSLIQVRIIPDADVEYPADIAAQSVNGTFSALAFAATGYDLVNDTTDDDYLVLSFKSDYDMTQRWRQVYDWRRAKEVDELYDRSGCVASDEEGNIYIAGISMTRETIEDDPVTCVTALRYEYYHVTAKPTFATSFKPRGDDEDELRVYDAAVGDEYLYVAHRYYDDPDSLGPANYNGQITRVDRDDGGFEKRRLFEDEEFHEVPSCLAVSVRDSVYLLSQRISSDTSDPEVHIETRCFDKKLRYEVWRGQVFIGLAPNPPEFVYATELALDAGVNVHGCGNVSSDSGGMLALHYDPTGVRRTVWELNTAWPESTASISLRDGYSLVVGTVRRVVEEDISFDIAVHKVVHEGPWAWEEVTSMPLAPSGKPVKRGAWATLHVPDGKIYATKGYKTTDFYSYDPYTDLWDTLSGMPFSTHPMWGRKVPRKGSKGVSDGDDIIYVTQGNNTLGFWAYHVSTDSWEILPDVPIGPRRKKVKGGTDLLYLVGGDVGYVYLLKGYKNEFYRFNVVTQAWEELEVAPVGIRDKYDKGSWLVYDGGHTLYAHKAKYHELWPFDLERDSWDVSQQLPGMPFIGMMGRKKKSKDGGSAVFLDGDIFALKGGNTQEFWRMRIKWDSAGDPICEWIELDTVPAFGSTGRKKRVKYGADLVYAGGAFFTLKGNKTVEFWKYRPEPQGAFDLHRRAPEAEAHHLAGSARRPSARVWRQNGRGGVRMGSTFAISRT